MPGVGGVGQGGAESGAGGDLLRALRHVAGEGVCAVCGGAPRRLPCSGRARLRPTPPPLLAAAAVSCWRAHLRTAARRAQRPCRPCHLQRGGGAPNRHLCAARPVGHRRAVGAPLHAGEPPPPRAAACRAALRPLPPLVAPPAQLTRRRRRPCRCCSRCTARWVSHPRRVQRPTSTTPRTRWTSLLRHSRTQSPSSRRDVAGAPKSGRRGGPCNKLGCKRQK
jgi:hypothetical protein